MEVSCQSRVTGSGDKPASATTSADNGPLIASEAGNDNASGRIFYDCGNIDTTSAASRRTIAANLVSTRNVIKRNTRSVISSGSLPTKPQSDFDIAHHIAAGRTKSDSFTPVVLKSTTRQGDCYTENSSHSAGRAPSRRTKLISRTKFHYVKMTGDQSGQESRLIEEVYPSGFMNKFTNKSSESIAMDSAGEDSSYCSSQSSGLNDKRLSIVSALSHSDYETCGSLTSLEDIESDRLSVCSGIKDDTSSIISGSIYTSNKCSHQSDSGQSSRPQSSVLGDSEFEESDFTTSEAEETTRPEEGRRRVRGANLPKRERPAILDQGMTATMAWLRSELMEIRKMDQVLIGQFMNIQGKIRTLKTQQQQTLQRRKQSSAARKQSLTGENDSELLGNHRFSWELDSLYEENEYYDYDTDEEESDDQEGGDSLGACGYS